MLLICVALVGLAFLLWWVPYVGLANIHSSLPFILGVIFCCLVLFGLGGALTLVFTIIRGKNLFFTIRIRGVVIRVLFPMLVVAGKCLGISKKEIQRSFIAINNQLVLAEAKKVKPDKLLLLLPHCLQNHECTIRITGDVTNCKACGNCKIKDLVELSEKYHVPISVASGGTLARKIVVEKPPSFSHHALALLMRNRYMKSTCITTNFDKLIETSFMQQDFSESQPIRNDEEAMYWINAQDRYYVLKLHGDYDTDNILNTASETTKISDTMLECVQNLLDYSGLVVIGSAGNEKSVHTMFDTLAQEKLMNPPFCLTIP